MFTLPVGIIPYWNCSWASAINVTTFSLIAIIAIATITTIIIIVVAV